MEHTTYIPGTLQPEPVHIPQESLYTIGELRDYPLLRPQKKANIGPCMAVSTWGQRLFAIQNNSQYPGGRLCVLDADLTLMGEFTGIGNTRQITLSGNTAMVTAREDGLFLLDISTNTPSLLAHYQTVEFATGITSWGHIAFISCRQYGVEVVDISEPTNPRHLGMIRVGEVQSVCVWDGYLYCGIWGAMCIIVVDIHDLSNPQIVNRIPLEGRGDGVLALDGKLYAVTGQHRRGIQNEVDINDPCYGTGNGMVVFDITDPWQPKPLHSEFFGKGKNTAFDMWHPARSGELLLSCCFDLGLFACDAHSYEPKLHILLPEQDGKPDAVTGFATMGSRIYLCGSTTDLYACDTGYTLGTCQFWESNLPTKVAPLPMRIQAEATLKLTRVYEGYIRDLCDCGDCYGAACGADGIRLLDKHSFKELFHLQIDGFCFSVQFRSNYLCAAMSRGGAVLLQKQHQSLRLISRIFAEAVIQQVLFSESGNYLWLTCGNNQMQLYDISNKQAPQLLVQQDTHAGPLYGENFATGQLDDGSIVLFCHRDGLYYTNPDEGDKKLHNIFYTRDRSFMGFGPENGCDTDGRHIFYNLRDGYVLLPLQNNANADRIPFYTTGVPLKGKLTLCGSYLVATERARGIITVADISNVHKPVHVGTAIISQSPAKAVFLDHSIFIPSCHGGLLLLAVKQQTGGSI